MKNSSILVLSIFTILLFTGCREDTSGHPTKAVKHPANSYLDSRVDAMDMAKQSVKESNKRSEERDKAMESLLK